MCSTKSQKIIEETSRRVLKIDINVRKTTKRFWFSEKNGKFCGVWDFGWASIQNEGFRILEGHKFKYRKDLLHVYSNCSRPDITMSVVLSRLKEIFNCQIIKCDIWTDGLGSLSKYLEGVTRCESFKCDGSDKICNQDMKFILEDLEVTDNYELGAYAMDDDFSCDRAIFTSSKSVNLKVRSPWFTSNIFLSSDCERIFLWACEFPAETFELFVTSWLNGISYQKLESIRIFETIEMNLEVLRSRGSAWDPKQRGRYFLIDEKLAIDCSEGIDILRADGKLATVLTNDKKFRMFVWHQRFPERTEKHRIEII